MTVTRATVILVSAVLAAFLGIRLTNSPTSTPTPTPTTAPPLYLAELRAQVRGAVLVPTDPEFQDKVRSIVAKTLSDERFKTFNVKSFVVAICRPPHFIGLLLL